MEPKSAAILAMCIGIGLAAIGPGIGMGNAVAAYINAVARQPEADNKVKPMLFVGLAFMEVLAIYAILMAFLAKFLFNLF